MISYDFNFPVFTPAGLIAVTGGLIAGASIIGIVFPGTNRSSILTEIDIEGQSNASAAATYAIFRTITTAAAGALTTVITGQPNTSLATQPTFSGSAGQSSFATTQPTLAAAPVKFCPANANGQRYYWKSETNYSNAQDMPGTATALLNGLILVQVAGTLGPVSARLQFKEI